MNILFGFLKTNFYSTSDNVTFLLVMFVGLKRVSSAGLLLPNRPTFLPFLCLAS